MKQLLILTSFFVVFFIEAKNTTYEIKEGDTLYSIAKENNISINKIFLANDNLGFSPDKIFIGNTILLPTNKVSDFEKICFSKLGFQQVHLFKSPDQVASECVEKLSQLIDINNINPLDIKYEEILYLVNKIYLDIEMNRTHLLLDGSKEIHWSIPNSKEREMLISAAMNGDLRAAYSAFLILPGGFSDYIFDTNLLQIRDHSRDFSDRKKSCNSFNSELGYENYDLLLYFYLECADTFFDAGDNDYIKFDNLLIDLIFSNDSKIIKTFEVYAVNSIAYRKLNTNDDLVAFNITNDFINLKCPNCGNSVTFHNKYTVAMYPEYPLVYPYSKDLHIAFNYFELNSSSADFRVNGHGPSYLEEYRDYYLDILKKNAETHDPDDNFGTRDFITATESDTALLLMQWGECDLASKYLDSAIKNYTSGNYDNSNHDYFIEPLYLSVCYIWRMLSTPKTDIEIAEGYFKRAQHYKDISLLAKHELDITNPLKLALLDLVLLFIAKPDRDWQEYFINLSNVLKDPNIYNFSGDIEIYDLIAGLYTSLYFISDYNNTIDTDLIIDPVTLIGMKNRFYITSKLINLKVEKTNSTLANLQLELKNNNKKINESSNNEIDYLEMLKLYKDNSMLIEDIFVLNDNLKKLTAPDTQSMRTVSESLKDNEFAYFLIPTPMDSIILLVSADDYRYWSMTSYAVIKPLISSFIDLNMNPGTDYDFEDAKFLGEYLFPMLYENNDQGMEINNSTKFILSKNSLA